MRLPLFARSRSGIVGLTLLGFVLAVALLGPLFAPYSPSEPIGVPGSGPSSEALLGTDVLGRDVLSRTLYGGLSVLWLGTVTTLLVMIGGLVLGMAAGYLGSWIDTGVMRVLDVVLSFPALLLILLLVTGLGASIPVLVLGVVAVQVPSVARMVRSATQEVATRGYIESAVARGERTTMILARDVLPNIRSIVVADVGVRFGYTIILIASMNFLGLGLEPPAADWGLMVSENRPVLGLNPLSVVAPAVLLALITVAVNVVADAYAQSRGGFDVVADDFIAAHPGPVKSDSLATS